jgi:hypothetical protein
MKNGYGKFFLDFCKGNKLFIVNGRIGDDRNKGKLTCKNASIVYYCISSVCLLKYFSNFAVLYLSHFYSDVHCPLEISMSCSAFDNAFENNENINLYIHSEKIHKWDQEKCSEKFDELKKVII